jgi:hypothetical protein
LNEQKLQQIQDEIMSGMDHELKLEKHILESSDEIASHLILTKKVVAEVNGTPYTFAFKLLENATGRHIYMLAANNIKRSITPEKYVPFSISAKVDEDYTLKDNLKTAVEGFIRHITGAIKPEVLGD